MTIDYATRAQSFVGTRFRPQGRGAGGLDCVGLALATYGISAESVRDDYALRGDHLGEVKLFLRDRFRRITVRQLRPGDLLILAPAEDQVHVAIQTSRGFVHAHASLRRVVETPGAPDWPILAVYRRRRGL